MPGGDDTRPLAGVTVLVTRRPTQAGGLAAALERYGARVLVMPVIEIVDPADWGPADAAIAAIATYDWIVFTSANAVDRFMARLEVHGAALPGTAVAQQEPAPHAHVAAVGPATAARCRSFGIEPDYMPDEAVAEGLIDGFEQLGLAAGARVLLPRALEAREVLPEALRARGVHVDVVPVYRTVSALPDPAILREIADGNVDVVTFTSPSSVRSFFDGLEGTVAREPARGLMFASIGQVTSAAFGEYGLNAQVEAPEHTADGLARAVAETFANGAGWA